MPSDYNDIAVYVSCPNCKDDVMDLLEHAVNDDVDSRTDWICEEADEDYQPGSYYDRPGDHNS